MADQSIEERVKLVLTREGMVNRKPEEIDHEASLVDTNVHIESQEWRNRIVYIGVNAIPINKQRSTRDWWRRSAFSGRRV